MAAAWERGEQVTVESLLSAHPELSAEAAIRLIYEEVCLRRDAGEEVGTAEVARRFPRWKNELEVLLDCDRLLRPLAPGIAFPEIGDTLGPFRLLGELGRGASGRTYLATEPALVDRQVVLKVIPADQEEHLRLARLQHTHIVPLYYEHCFNERGLRALCMPYLGGASLAQILKALGTTPIEHRHGRDVIEVLEEVQARVQIPGSGSARLSGVGPCWRYLEGASYVEAMCWIGTCMAEALEYAHARGLFHMDITPANVLITGDGQPMLLDFHLARGPIQAGEWVVGRLGGTPGWMSPEQEAALDAVSAGHPAPGAVDARADIHAVGLLLQHTLWGTGLKRSETGFHQHRRPPGVSVGLWDIVHKCLASHPASRYPTAGALGSDLRLHLNHLPLCGVANRSPIERVRKWQRRAATPLRQAARLSALLAGIVVGALAIAVYYERVQEVEAYLEDGRRYCVERRYSEALHVLNRGVERARAVPGALHLHRALTAEVEVARRGHGAAELHRLLDAIRFRYGLASPGREEAEVVARQCHALWAVKDVLTRTGGARLDDETERSIKTDFLELAVVWADLNVRLAPRPAAAAARRASLEILDQARAAFGPSPSLDRERQAHARELGQPTPRASKPTTAPLSAWEHYDLGRSYLRSGQVEAAAEEFRRTLDERPQDFWSNFYQGLCAYRLGNYEMAYAAYRTCTALAPEAAELYYNRALALEALGRSDQARADYNRALELNPRLTAAALNRGLLGYKAGRHHQAIGDLLCALRLGSGTDAMGQIHYNLALAYLAAGDHSAALSNGRKALELGYGEAQGLCQRLGR
jgi:serine/threonine protein kinase/tetratricopeptide (TPR) repeat protein